MKIFRPPWAPPTVPTITLLQLPPGQVAGVDATVENALAAASRSAAETNFVVELAAASLLDHGQPYIQLALAKLDAVDTGTQPPNAMVPTAADMRAAVTRFLEVGR